MQTNLFKSYIVFSVISILSCGDTNSDRTTNNNGTNNGTTNHGTANNESTNNESTNNGSTNNGSTNNGNPMAPCMKDDPFTCLKVGTKVYGEHTFNVNSKRYWVNTGLYLKTGDSFNIKINSGEFNLNNDLFKWHSPWSECALGQLTGRIGLTESEGAFLCVDDKLEGKATSDGILFLGMLAGTSVEELNESRLDAEGTMSVTVTSDGNAVPSVFMEYISSYPFQDIDSGWVEVSGKHVQFVVPTALAVKDRKVLSKALTRLDNIYKKSAELRGLEPFEKQRIRFFPDESIGRALMYAGNPVFMNKELTNINEPGRITNPENNPKTWAFAHELGHDFAFANGVGDYQTNPSIEAWCNLFALYAFETLDLETPEFQPVCEKGDTGSWPWDGSWTNICFLRQFVFEFGWDFYTFFYARLDKIGRNDISDKVDYREWPFVYEQFQLIAKEKGLNRDTITDLFKSWNVPYQR